MSTYITVDEAKQEAVRELARKPDWIYIGQGLVNPKTWNGLLKRLQRKYYLKIVNYPLSEASLGGIATGLAIMGMKVYVFFPRHDFALLAMDTIVNESVYWKYLFGEQVELNITYWLLYWKGVKGGYGAQHVNNYTSYYAHLPRVRVYAPTTPSDYYNALIEAYSMPGIKFIIDAAILGRRKEEYSEYVEKATGKYGEKARVLVEGADVTIVSYSGGVLDALKYAEKLSKEGVSAEVIDMRLVKPMDIETIAASVEKTRKLYVVETGFKYCSIASEVIAQLKERGLEFEVKRLGYPEYPVPSSWYLEEKYYELR